MTRVNEIGSRNWDNVSEDRQIELVSSAGTDLAEHRLSRLDLSLQRNDDQIEEIVRHLHASCADARAAYRSGIEAFAARNDRAQAAVAQSHQSALVALNAKRSRDAELWAEMTRNMADVTFDMPELDVDAQLCRIKHATTMRAQISNNICSDDLAKIQISSTSNHEDQMKEIARFTSEIEAFSRMSNVLIEVQQKAMCVVKENWRETRMNQLEVVRSAITEVIRDREDRRKDIQLAHEHATSKRDQSYQEEMGVKKQSHAEAVDLENLAQARAKQKRADDLADRRVELEEALAKFNHDLEMNKVDANKSRFWTTFIKIFR